MLNTLFSIAIIMLLNTLPISAQNNSFLLRTTCFDVNGVEVKKYWYLEESLNAEDYERFEMNNRLFKVYPFHIPQFADELLFACESCDTSLSINKKLVLDSIINNNKNIESKYDKLFEDFLTNFGDPNYDKFFNSNKCFNTKVDSIELTVCNPDIVICKCLVFIGYRYKYTDYYAIPKKIKKFNKISKYDKLLLKEYSNKILSIPIINDYINCGNNCNKDK